MERQDFLDSICHRKPERSFFIKGYQFPVCARCTGIYISLLIYFIYSHYVHVDYNFYLLLFGFILLIPAYIDGITQFHMNRESNNNLRLVTGLLCGLGLGIILKTIIFFLFSFFKIN